MKGKAGGHLNTQLQEMILVKGKAGGHLNPHQPITEVNESPLSDQSICAAIERMKHNILN